MLSVIVPTFNRASMLDRSVQSVLWQTYLDWELIIVDDGSTDETASKVRQLQTTYHTRKISYLQQDNQGPASARNAGVAAAQGDVVVYLDSDDLLYPSALLDIQLVMKETAALYGLTNHNRTIILQDDAGKELARRYDTSGLSPSVSLEQIYNWEIKTTSSGLFHRKALFDSGIHWRSGFYIEDLEFLLQLAAAYAHGFRHIPKVLVDYEQIYGGDGLCSRASYADWAHAFATIYDYHKSDPLMRRPEVYLERVTKYRELHRQAQAGFIPPPQRKYFPE
jgi:glycosyltransferase involved in cell wall biosynthesis